MKFGQFEWLADFIFLVSLFVAMNGLLKLHSLGQPLLGVIAEAFFLAAIISLFSWIRKHGDD